MWDKDKDQQGPSVRIPFQSTYWAHYQNCRSLWTIGKREKRGRDHQDVREVQAVTKATEEFGRPGGTQTTRRTVELLELGSHGGEEATLSLNLP